MEDEGVAVPAAARPWSGAGPGPGLLAGEAAQGTKKVPRWWWLGAAQRVKAPAAKSGA